MAIADGCEDSRAQQYRGACICARFFSVVSGHFPGEPILPGMALVHVVWQAIVREAGKRAEEITLTKLKRVRFTQPVRPGDHIAVLITVIEEGSESTYSFKVVSGENVICSGGIAAKKINK